jgi:hypothetical protein
MSDQLVKQALRALQGLKAHKVMSVLQDLRVQRERQVQKDLQDLWEQQEPLALKERLEPRDQ